MKKWILCECSARGIWDSREGQQPFLPNPDGIWDRTTTLRLLLIGAVLTAFAPCNAIFFSVSVASAPSASTAATVASPSIPVSVGGMVLPSGVITIQVRAFVKTGL